MAQKEIGPDFNIGESLAQPVIDAARTLGRPVSEVVSVMITLPLSTVKVLLGIDGSKGQPKI